MTVNIVYKLGRWFLCFIYSIYLFYMKLIFTSCVPLPWSFELCLRLHMAPNFPVYNKPKNYRKINSAYAFEELQVKCSGLKWILDSKNKCTDRTVSTYIIYKHINSRLFFSFFGKNKVLCFIHLHLLHDLFHYLFIAISN